MDGREKESSMTHVLAPTVDFADSTPILDEPEAALSPTGCLALVRRFNELANEGSQFIIATHSPIVMSFPGALIYLLGESGPKPVSWEEVDHVRIMREFLNDPEIVLRVLLSENARS